MLGDIVQGAVAFGTSFIDNAERKRKIAESQAAYDRSLDAYFNQDTSNLMLGLQNTAEDLTVNTQAADFAAAQQRQGMADILGQTRAAAGGSGIASLAQALANQSNIAAQRASIDIGQQERANQMAERQQAANIQTAERQGEAASRALRAQLLGERATIDANQLAAAEKAQQDALQARYQGLGQALGGVADVALAGFSGPSQVLGELKDADGNPIKDGDGIRRRAFFGNLGDAFRKQLTGGK